MSSLIEKNLKSFEPLAKYYASKVFNYERFGFEKEDIVQEMRIKVYMSIVGFARQWKEFRDGKSHKPAPIEYWVRSALNNKVKDFIRKFNQENVANIDKISLASSGEDSVDIGYNKTSDFVLDVDKGIAILNGVNIVKKLKGERRDVYIYYMMGYSQYELSKKYHNIDVQGLIERHNKYLIKNNSQELLDFRNDLIQTHVQTED